MLKICNTTLQNKYICIGIYIYFLLILNNFSNACVCPSINNINLTSSMAPNLNYGNESWLYEINIGDYNTSEPHSYSILFTRTPINDCNDGNTDEHHFLEVIRTDYESAFITTHYEFISIEETDSSKLSFYVGNNYLKRLQNNNNEWISYIKLFLDDDILWFTIHDNKSLFKIGKNMSGYVNVNMSNYICNGYIGQMIMRGKTILEGNITGNGYASGRHLITSNYSKKSIKLYSNAFHWNYGDIIITNNNGLLTGMIYIAGMSFWLDSTNIDHYLPLDYWTSPQTNKTYPIEFDLWINNPSMYLYMKPVKNNQEIIINNNSFWVSPGISVILGINNTISSQLGIGIMYSFIY